MKRLSLDKTYHPSSRIDVDLIKQICDVYGFTISRNTVKDILADMNNSDRKRIDIELNAIAIFFDSLIGIRD